MVLLQCCSTPSFLNYVCPIFLYIFSFRKPNLYHETCCNKLRLTATGLVTSSGGLLRSCNSSVDSSARYTCDSSLQHLVTRLAVMSQEIVGWSQTPWPGAVPSAPLGGTTLQRTFLSMLLPTLFLLCMSFCHPILTYQQLEQYFY